MSCDNCGVTADAMMELGIHPEEAEHTFEYLDGMLLCLPCADECRDDADTQEAHVGSVN